METTYTEGGKAILIHRDLATLRDEKWATQGSIGLFLLLDSQDRPTCWTLMWEWGGDWMVFGDGDQYNAKTLEGWEPTAIREAIETATELLPDADGLAESLEWFEDWAEVAESTLKENA